MALTILNIQGVVVLNGECSPTAGVVSSAGRQPGRITVFPGGKFHLGSVGNDSAVVVDYSDGEQLRLTIAHPPIIYLTRRSAWPAEYDIQAPDGRAIITQGLGPMVEAASTAP